MAVFETIVFPLSVLLLQEANSASVNSKEIISKNINVCFIIEPLLKATLAAFMVFNNAGTNYNLT